MKKPKTSQLQPHEGALPLKLGMLQSEVRALCGTPLDKTPKYDYSHRNGLQVEYRKERVAFIQISRGFGLVAQYQGVDVLAASAEDIIKLVSTDAPYDAKHPELGYTYRFPFPGITFWRPVCPTGPSDTEGKFFKTVAIAVRGCWT
jgi:hypothetical protein